MTASRLYTRLYELEGKQNLQATVKTVAKAAADLKVRKIVVFTSEGDGAMELQKRISGDRKVIAVTFPHEMTARPKDGEPMFIGLPSHERRLDLESLGVTIVQGAMPFQVTNATADDALRGMRTAFGAFGGGLQLCVQGVLMACDAGHLNAGERCIAMSADTAIVARSGHSYQIFQKAWTFAVEHFLCKPQYYQITRGDWEVKIGSFYNQELLGTDAQPDEGATPLPAPTENPDAP